MGFGTNTNVNILRAPNVEGITSGLQNAILNAQQQSRLEQQDSDKALADLGALSKTRTIRDTLGNINKEGGVQSGLEVQDAASQRYNDLTTKYQDMLDQHDELSKQAKANGLITYDANGQETTDYTNPQLVALAENKKKLDSTYQKELEGLNTALSTRYKANPDMLNTVTNPADYEKRLADTLRTKGISDDVARATAKKEAAPYYAKDLTERQKAQIKDMSARRKLIIDNPANDQSITRGNGGGGRSGGSSRTKYTSSNVKDLLTKGDALLGISKSKENRHFWEFYDSNTATSKEELSAHINEARTLAPDASDNQILRAMSSAFEGDSSENPQLNNAKFKTALAGILSREGTGGSKSYGGGSKGGTYSNVTTRNKGYSKNQLATVDKLNSSIDAILSGGRNKTVDEVLGKDFTTRTTKKDIVKAPVKGTTKAQSLFTGTDSLSKAMRTPKGDGALVKALLANPDGFHTTFSKMNPKQQASIGKVLSTPANVKLLDSLTSKPKAPKAPKAPVRPVVKETKATAKYTPGMLTKDFPGTLTEFYKAKAAYDKTKNSRKSDQVMYNEFSSKVSDMLRGTDKMKASRGKVLVQGVLKSNPTYDNSKLLEAVSILQKRLGKDPSEKQIKDEYIKRYITNIDSKR